MIDIKTERTKIALFCWERRGHFASDVAARMFGELIESGAHEGVPVVATCKWTEETDTGVHETQCGHAHYFNDGDVKENEYQFCPFCGKRIEVGK